MQPYTHTHACTSHVLPSSPSEMDCFFLILSWFSLIFSLISSYLQQYWIIECEIMHCAVYMKMSFSLCLCFFFFHQFHSDFIELLATSKRIGILHFCQLCPILFHPFSAASSLQLRAREHPGWCTERHNHRGDMGASPRGLRHNHRLVHRHLPEAAGPRPEQAGVQDRRGPGRGMNKSLHKTRHPYAHSCLTVWNFY